MKSLPAVIPESISMGWLDKAPWSMKSKVSLLGLLSCPEMALEMCQLQSASERSGSLPIIRIGACIDQELASLILLSTQSPLEGVNDLFYEAASQRVTRNTE